MECHSHTTILNTPRELPIICWWCRPDASKRSLQARQHRPMRLFVLFVWIQVPREITIRAWFSQTWYLPNSSRKDSNPPPHAMDNRHPVYKPMNIERLKNTAPALTVVFTEDKNGFYINGSKFTPDAPAMTSARVGTYQHWRIVNSTSELHPFHIHQVHFFAYAENGVALRNPAWLDTVNVPYGGTVDVILDFTNPCRFRKFWPS